MEWFSVDKRGLEKTLARRGKAFVLFELLQNAWDTEATKVEVVLQPIEGRPLVNLSVTDDDPEGFADLSHAFTLFAESLKKGDPEKRGRFNLGEKLVLALCERATIASTSGTIVFDKEGRRKLRGIRDRGSVFEGLVRMTRAEMDECLIALKSVLPPKGVETSLNGELLAPRPESASVLVTLPTEIADEEGQLRRTRRQCVVTLHELLPGETPFIYELGLPIVETEGLWHINVHQKVPLSMERDNVTPAYLKELRVAVVNKMHPLLKGAQASSSWVREALGDTRVSPEAVDTLLTERFGKKRVSYDASDPEANKLAVSQGFTVIPGGSLSAGEWGNAKREGLVLPAGKVTPSPKPYSSEGDELKLLPDDHWSPEMCRLANFAKWLARDLFQITLTVRIANDKTWPFSATYGPGRLTLNWGVLGDSWFQNPLDEKVLSLLIHEFGHHTVSDHLSSAYHEALCSIGAKIALRLAAGAPDFQPSRG